ncbi:unnamed protein product [Timema podura]|uniref:IRS-type PTB domain-containing protein n=1 Tax=Timema podura TaxID=61482 RepID=A0ABN7NMN6_TIMPD|nr:unnamed protein product [Timema podura]
MEHNSRLFCLFVSDCLHLQLYRDSKDRYKQGQTKASLSLQHFLGFEAGFTLDKESNTIAIICQDVTVILAFDTRERLIQWQVKISNNLGEDQQFLIQISSAPPKTKIASGPARLHVQDQRFCITVGVPPRLVGIWEFGHLRRYGVVEGRFCFEGGSRCGRGEGLYVCVTDKGEEITHTFQLASQGKLTSRRRPITRKSSVMDSPRKQLHSRAEMRMSEGFNDSFQHNNQFSQLAAGDLNRSLYGDDTCCGCSMGDSAHENSRHQSSEDLLCPCRNHGGSRSPFWSSAESASHHHTDLDSNYGCGDTTSVSELPDQHYHVQDSIWPESCGVERRMGPTSLERCASCIGKLGGPSMSRSSTVTNTNTPNTPFSPAWTMESVLSLVPVCQHFSRNNVCALSTTTGSISGDRVSLSSQGSSGNSDYSVPSFVNANGVQGQCRYDRPRGGASTHPAPPVVPPKTPRTPTGQKSLSLSLPVSGSKPPTTLPVGLTPKCQCCPPVRPPKPSQMTVNSPVTESPTKKKFKKPPMPLPSVPTPPTCSCHHSLLNIQQRPNSSADIGPYDNYDVPKSVLGSPLLKDHAEELNHHDAFHRHSVNTTISEEYYDTPKNIKECLASTVTTMPSSQYGNYDVPPAAMTLRKPCGCVIKFAKKSTSLASPNMMVGDYEERAADCPCRRVMCWAENWMMLPYCRRGSGVENTGVPIHKVKLSGEGKMPVRNPSGEIAIYATVDKSKKAIRRLELGESGKEHSCTMYLEPQSSIKNECVGQLPTLETTCSVDSSNYENVDPNSITYEASSSQLVVCESKKDEVSETGPGNMNYQNIDFAQSLEFYENSKDVLIRSGLSKNDMDEIAIQLTEKKSEHEPALSYLINDGVKVCNKCGHTCHLYSSDQPPSIDSNDVTVVKQDDYQMMEPGNVVETLSENVSNPCSPSENNFPGYLPMNPINILNSKAATSNIDFDIMPKAILVEKSASTPSLTGPAVDGGRSKNALEFSRIPDPSMVDYSNNSPYLPKALCELNEENRRQYILARKRSSSADSSRFLDDFDDMGSLSITDSSMADPCESSISSQNNDNPSSCVETMASQIAKTDNLVVPSCVQEPTDSPEGEEVYVSETIKTLSIRESNNTIDTLVEGVSSDSLRTLVQECVVMNHQRIQVPQFPSSVHIRRSSSVPCKSGNNRDSSSSNDSGVSIDSLRHRGTDFSEFELPLTTAMSSRRHYQSVIRQPGALLNCLHSSLPRRSKSVDPLREISFQFQKINIPAKSSSAEAEIPICPIKGLKGFASPNADGATTIPYIDSRSTSSGTSDMSDYIETLSLSSYSSSDTAADSLRFSRLAATTLRPRSGKEYQLIDRYVLETDIKTTGDKPVHQLRGLSQYANITPLLEKSKSPSTGYMSSSLGQKKDDQ